MLSSLFAALAGGILSFVSPCVLPLIPAYLSFIAGTSSSAPGTKRLTDKTILQRIAPSLLFLLGFSLVVIALGVAASFAGRWLTPYREVLRIASGILLVVFGVILLGVFKTPWLYREARIDPAGAKRFQRGSAFFIGMAFAFGWTPCVGPILASILALAGAGSDPGWGAILLAVYSVGFSVPFILMSLFLNELRPVVKWLNAHARILQVIGGSVLIVVGILIATDTLTYITGFFTGLFG